MRWRRSRSRSWAACRSRRMRARAGEASSRTSPRSSRTRPMASTSSGQGSRRAATAARRGNCASCRVRICRSRRAVSRVWATSSRSVGARTASRRAASTTGRTSRAPPRSAWGWRARPAGLGGGRQPLPDFRRVGAGSQRPGLLSPGGEGGVGRQPFQNFRKFQSLPVFHVVFTTKTQRHEIFYFLITHSLCLPVFVVKVFYHEDTKTRSFFNYSFFVSSCLCG